jgi:signal transduction histidine kinase
MKRYKQVLYNLIGNALKFTFKGGIFISVKYENSSRTLSTSVEDTGVGIKED